MDPLSLPVAALMRTSPVLNPEDSLLRAAEALRETAYGAVPVVSGPYLMGIVTEQSLVRTLGSGASIYDPIQAAIDRPVAVLAPYVTGSEALRGFEATGAPELVVIDSDGRFIGVVSPSDLFPKPEQQLHPGMVGGMATPFGVYLTNGAIRAGASDVALVATGMLLFTMIFGASSLTDWAVASLPDTTPLWLAATLFNVLPILLFMVAIRLIPLSGIHAAEHKVVHAIERGEPLVPEVVNRMPRVHPRCGTNLAVGLSLFLGISQTDMIPDPELRLLLGLLVTLFFWRSLGNLVQQFVTTKPPNAKQLQMGIDAGKQLLEKYRTTRAVHATPFQRIWASGMLHVMAGSLLCFGIVQGLALLLGFPLIQ